MKFMKFVFFLLFFGALDLQSLVLDTFIWSNISCPRGGHSKKMKDLKSKPSPIPKVGEALKSKGFPTYT
jgi:hypothetical protein